jgi:glycosyltransferase involved in cell wall biosynthesis
MTAPLLREEELRVLALIENLEIGGAQAVLAQFANTARDVGVELSVACLGGLEDNRVHDELRAAGIAPVNLDAPRRIGPRALKLVASQIATVRPDVVHTHLDTADFLGGIAARWMRVRAVCSLHATEWTSRDLHGRTRLALMAAARRHCADRVIAVSHSARTAYIARGWDTPERVLTIHNGIDVSPRPGSGAAVRRELGLEPDDFVVGMIAPLRRVKGHDIAIETARLLRTTTPRVRLLIAGEGAWRSEVTRLAEPLGETVVQTRARSDVMSLLDALDVSLHPSRSDAFPTSMLEAMAASVPVVASAVGGIPEVVEDGSSGMLVSPPFTPQRFADALRQLIHAPGRRSELAAGGRARYQNRFTAGPWARRTRSVYETVLGDTADARRPSPC